MYRSITTTPSNLRVFIAFFLAFTILVTPIAALAIPAEAKPTPKTEAKTDVQSPTEPQLPRAVAAPLFVPEPAVAVAASLSATLTDDILLSAKKNPGDTINYTAAITNAPGTSPIDDASSVVYTSTLDTNTTLVGGSINVSPLAFNDAYDAIGNTLLEVGNATAQTGPQKSLAGSVITNDVEFLGDTFTISAFDATSVNGGTVTMVTSGVDRGSFTYISAANFTGTDTFTYTIRDDGTDSIAGNADDLTGVGIVTITVANQVWYVDNSAAPGGDGRSTTPFDALADVSGGAGLDGTGDIIFVNTGSGDYTGGITLLVGQTLWGRNETLVVDTFTLLAAGTAPNITNAAGDGVVLATNGNNTLKGFTVGNTTGYDIASTITTSVGTLTVFNVDLNGTGGLLRVDSGGALTITLDTASTTSATGNGIQLTGTTGTVTVNGSGTISGVAGVDVLVSGGTVSMTCSPNITQANNAAMVSIGGGHTTGTITFSGTLSATNGTGLQFDNADSTTSYNFNGTNTLNGGDAGIDILNGSAGTFNFSSNTSINNPTGIAYREDTSTANVTYPGTITKNNSSANAVDINAKSAGTTAFSGAITASTGTAAAIDLTNSGGTVNFTAGLSLTTTSGTGFNATGGGTVNATQNNTSILNTVSTTTGTGVNIVTPTNIGVNGVTFRSVTVNNGALNSATNGIVLNGTTGTFLVSGDGSQTAGLFDRDGSGGTLNKTTGHSVLLTNAQNVTLRQMNITNTATGGACPGACTSDAVHSTTGQNIVLSAVTLQNLGGNGWNAANITGTNAINNNSLVSTWNSASTNGVTVASTTSNFSGSFTVDHCIFTTSATGAVGFLFDVDTNAGGGTVTVTNSEFTLIDQGAVQINHDAAGILNAVVQKNNFHDADATGGDGNNHLFMGLAGSGRLNFTIGGPTPADGNTFTNLARLSANAGVCQVNAAGGTASTGAKLNGTIQNNTLTNPGFVSQRRGIMVAAEASSGNHGGHTVLIANNSVQNFFLQGIYASMTTINAATSNNDNLNNNITIINNQVGNIAAVGQNGGDSGSAIEFETNNANAAQGSDISVNLHLEGNTAVSNNSSGIGDTVDISSFGNGSPNTSVINVTALGNNLTQSNAGGQVFESRTVLDAASSMCLDLNAGNTSPNTATGGNGTGFRVTQDAGSGTYSIDGMGAGAQTAAAVDTFLSARNTGAVTTSGSFVGAPGGCTDATLPTLMFSAPEVASAADAQPATDRLEQLRSNSLASIAGISNGSNSVASLSQWFSEVTSSIPRFANSVASLVSPTAYAETEKSEVRSQKSEVRNAIASRHVPRNDVRLNHAAGRRTPVANNSTITSAPMMPFNGEPVNATIGTLPAGKTVTIKYAAIISTTPTAGSVSTQGTISSNLPNFLTSDPDPGSGPGADATVTNIAMPDLTITKSHAGTFKQGDTGKTYTITPRNNGDFATFAGNTVTVTDTLPAGLTPTGPIGAHNGWTCNISTQTLTCTRSDSVAAATNYPTITLTVNVDNNAGTPLNNTVTVTAGSGGEVVTNNNSFTDPTVIVQAPDLTIDKAHSGNFFQGQTGAQYTITVGNAGPGPVLSGDTVTVTDTLPVSGFTATSISGTGWVCTPPSGPCTRSGANTALPVGNNYPVITLTGNVAANAPTGAAAITNSASVSGGGEINTANNTDNDPTTVDTGTDLTILKSHTGIWTQGDTGKTYTITVSNVGGTASSGMVTVTDVVPTGLTPTAPIGAHNGWTCGIVSQTLTCTRSDVLAASASYPNITLTVNISNTAPPSVTNTATVSGGNDVNGTNNSSDDITNIAALCSTPPPNMTNWWTSDNTPRDIAGGKDGTLNGGMGYAAGKVLNGFSFDGVDDYVDVGDVDLSSTFTIDAWVNPTDLTSERAIVSKDDGSARSYFFHITSTGALRALVHSAGGFTEYQTAAGVVTAGSFQHVAVTYDGAAAATQRLLFYKNGALVPAVLFSQDAGGTPENNALAARIGRSADGSSLFFGVIDEVEFFSRVLSAAELNAIFTADSGGKCKPSDLKIAKSHIGNFNQNSTGNNYTITVHNDGPSTTSGTTTVTDMLPAGLTATAMSGSGWTCPGPFPAPPNPTTFICTSTAAIASGADFPPITLTVNVGVNTASAINQVAVSGGGEMDTSDDTASDSTTLTPVADLSITKTDGAASEVPGTPVTYTIIVSNAGPSDVTGATVADVFPVTITGVNYTSVPTGGATGNTAGAGNINDTVNMPSGSTITYTATGTISSSATVSVSNTATVTAPGGVIDAGGNNSATDTDTLSSVADLSITKTDGATDEVPGTPVTYTITVTNAGPSDVTGATVADVFPGTITGVNYTSVPTGGATGNTAGAGNINDTVNMPSGSTITYTATGTIASSATVSVSNTATVTAPGGVTDAGGNNSATDTDTLTTTADLQITKTDGVTDEVPGTPVTYTITVTNAGPSNVIGATVADAFPVTITGVNYTSVPTGGATGNTAGAGNINDTVNMPSGSTITYTATGTISPSATGSLSNTATVTAPGGVTDAGGNNSATDTDTLTPAADLSITKTDGAASEVPGTSVTYTITVTNAGPSDVTGATVADVFPGTITGVNYTSVPTGGATGNTAGAGNINDTVNMPSGSTITYTATGTISSAATGSLSNTATVTAPGGVTDAGGNNSATDTDTLTTTADLQITKTDGATDEVPGTPVTYTITVTNAGPSNVIGATVADAFPVTITGVNYTSVPTGGATGNTAGAGNINDTVNMPSGSTITYTATGTISSSATVSVSNTATVTAPGGVIDAGGNNSSTDTDTLTPAADLLATKIDSPDPVVVGTNLTYTITVTNNGSSDAQNLSLSDTVPPSTTFVSFTVPGGWTRTDVTPVGGTGTVTATAPTLAAGASAVFTLVVNVNLATPHNTVLTNSATVTTTTADPNLVNNTATTTTTVTSTLALTVNDSGDAADTNVGDRICDTSAAAGDQCSLRAAIQETNAAATADTIDFSLPANTTITPLFALNDINGDLVITGPASGVTVSGNNLSLNRVFRVLAGETVSILNLTIANGQSSQGGGIANSGNLTISNSTFTGNRAVGGNAQGGAIYSNSGTLTILNSTISGNTANGSGGGLFNTGTSTAILVNVTVTNNRTDADGAAPGPGGGIAQSSSNPVTLRNTIVAGNFTGVAPGTAPDEISGTVDASSNNNLIGAAGFGGLTNGVNNNQVGVADARLAPLANNGGPTQTHALLAGATALDAGDNTTATNAGLTTDQRGPGFARSADGPDADATATVDIGAFEAQVWVQDILDRSMPEDGSDSFSFNVGGAAAITTVTATSSNTGLVPNNAANLNVSGSGSTRTLTINPVANQNGSTIITVTVNSASGSMTDTFVLTVWEVNDAPTANNDTIANSAEDSGPRTILASTLTGNDSQGPNEGSQTLIIKTVSSPVGGTVSIVAGNVVFTPTANYNGPASFQYTVEDNGTTNGAANPLTSGPATVSFNITDVNDSPDAVDDGLSSVVEDSGMRTIAIASLLANDTTGPANESGQTLTLTGVSNPIGGTVSSDATNVYFTLAADFNGVASFQYTVTDNGTTNGAADPRSDTATVSFTVTEVNDAPVPVNDPLGNMEEDAPQRTIPFSALTGNDSRGAANESGQTLIVKTVSNPVGLTVSIVAGTVRFTPLPDYNGPASFRYTVEDNGTTNGAPDPKTSATSALVHFNITEVNDAPTAVNDTLPSMPEDAGPQTIPFATLTANDLKGPANESSQTLTVKTVSNPVGGTVSIVAGDVVFTPTPNFNGVSSFDYTVEDNGTTDGVADPKTSNTATASFANLAVADTPSVTNATTNANTQTTSGLVISRNPADGAEVTHFKITAITGGSLFKNDGVTPINNGDFITFAEGNAGLKFTPGTVNGSFLVQASTSASDAGLGGGTVQATIIINPLGGVIRFSSATYSVAEGAGFRTITVERSGDTSQAVTVDYVSSDHSNPADFIPCTAAGAGQASSRCDFTTAIGTLRFAAGETSKTFNVLISNDNYVEGPETLDLTLSNATNGAVFGVPQTAILTITDDLTEPATNPIDNAADFVRAQYHDVLNREPDAAGLAFWTDNIEKCNDPARRPAGQTVAQCIDKQRESTAIAFFKSPEFQMTGGFIYNLYKGSLTGTPTYDSPNSSPGRFPTFLEFMHDMGQVSEGIVVNNQISGAVVEANRNALATAFVQRPEFVAKYGGLNNTLYVQELFNTTGITATAAQKQALVDGLTNGTETRASVLRKVVDGTVVISEANVQFTTPYGQAFINQENRRLFVYLEYVGYLRRNPDAAGFVFWLGKLNFYNGDPFQAEMVRSFILSPEYRSRFGTP